MINISIQIKYTSLLITSIKIRICPIKHSQADNILIQILIFLNNNLETAKMKILKYCHLLSFHRLQSLRAFIKYQIKI